MEIIREKLKQILREGTLEIRGDGRAGSGLMLSLQAIAALAVADPILHVQEWPFFSAARKGVPTRGFLRLSHHPIQKGSQITHPHLVIAMDEAVGLISDFAQGVASDGIFIINTASSPEKVAKKFKLSGTVYTIDGDALSKPFLKKPLGNISIFALLTEILPGFQTGPARDCLKKLLEKRRIPLPIIESNLKVFDESIGKSLCNKFNFSGALDHQLKPFSGYGPLVPGAQSSLRLSRSNKTATYAKTGHVLHFADPEKLCNGCAHCIINCPENVIRFVPDRERGVLVLGADVTNYCKLCGECIAVCPKKLFTETRV